MGQQDVPVSSHGLFYHHFSGIHAQNIVSEAFQGVKEWEKFTKREKSTMYGNPYRKAQKDHRNESLVALDVLISWMSVAK